MSRFLKIASSVLVLGLVFASFVAVAGARPSADAAPPAGAKAYGKHCQGQSKKHVAGQKGTPFSQCVTAMAKLAAGKTDSPQQACEGMSKKHVKGEQGTPFSRCVAAGAKLLQDEQANTGDSASG